MHFNTFTIAALLAATVSVSAQSTNCYNHPGPLQRFGDYSTVSHEKCTNMCKEQGFALAGAMNGNECWCGKAYPPENNQISTLACDSRCVGFPDENCGGQGFWSIWPIVTPASASSFIPTATPSYAFRG